MITVGELIEKERAKTNITREQLSYGMCSQQALYRSGTEDSIMGILMFEMLLERLGQSTDGLEYIMSQDEYDKAVMRDDIEDEILRNNAAGAEKLLAEYKASFEELTGVNEMYYYRTMAAIKLYCGNKKEDYNEGLKYILKAVKMTLNDIKPDNYGKYLCSTYEAENILMYIKALCMIGDVEKGVKLLVDCYGFFEKKLSDDALKVRVLPKCAYMMAEYGEKLIGDDKLADYLEEGIDLLRSYSIIYMLKPLMGKLIECYKRVGKEDKVDYWMPYYNLLCELYKEYDNGRRQDALFYRWLTASYYLESEVIRDERVAQGMTQMELADGIYKNIASVSNIEKGKSSPNKNKYRAIAEKLLIDKGRISGFVVADSLDKIRRIAEIKELTSRGETEKVLELTADEAAQSDKERCLLKAYRSIAQYEGQIDDKEKLESMKENVEGIYNLDNEEYIRRPFQAEMDIIGAYLAVFMRVNEKEAGVISDKLLRIYEKTHVNFKYCYRAYSTAFLCTIRKKDVYDNNNSFLTEQSFIQYCINTGKGSALVGLNWRTALTIPYRDERKKDYLYKGYMFAQLYKYRYAKGFKDYYDRLYAPLGTITGSESGSGMGGSSLPSTK